MKFLALVFLVACGGAQRTDRIDLALVDTPIYDALVAVGKRARVNLSLDPDITGTVTITARNTPWRIVLDRIVKQHDLRVEELRVGNTGRTVLRVARASTPPSTVEEFSGAPIEVHFDDTPIRAAMLTIANLAKVRIVVDDGIDTLVTQHTRDVPWDLVLDHVARKYSLRVIRDGETLRISK